MNIVYCSQIQVFMHIFYGKNNSLLLDFKYILYTVLFFILFIQISLSQKNMLCYNLN